MTVPTRELLKKIHTAVRDQICAVSSPWPRYTLFLSFSNGCRRANVVHGTDAEFDALWESLLLRCAILAKRRGVNTRLLRADWVKSVIPMSAQEFRSYLNRCKRNYFRYGIALDALFDIAFLEQELNANAMLYGGGGIAHAVINEKNIKLYGSHRFPGRDVCIPEDGIIYLLETQGVFCDLDSAPVLLFPTGLNCGRRMIEFADERTVEGLIEKGSRYLASQVREDGRFNYGWHACFDRPILAYNALRHASTCFAMLDAWDISRDPMVLQAIERALGYLTEYLIERVRLPSGESAAFLVDQGGEIKLGGNAVCLLALSRYCELLGSDRYLALLEGLALGICFMQDPESGQFVHVLKYPELSTKERFRIIYYDGEAAFGLMRLHRLTSNPRWLGMVERAFEHFIASEHWRAHDHWLGYCVNELTLLRPDERYYRFGIRNVAGHLDFVLERITTFPTLLELMMAAKAMLERIDQQPSLRHLLAEIDREKFDRALVHRAAYLMNGHFWPEYAMFFRNPKRIVGSFFIRHHAFRVRIDDVEHYLSGYVAYLKHLRGKFVGTERGQPAEDSSSSA